MVDDDIDTFLEAFDENLFAESLSFFDINPPVLDITDFPLSEPVFINQSSSEIGEADAPLSEPGVSEFLNQNLDYRSDENIQVRGETSSANLVPAETRDYTGFGDLVFPVPPVPYSCTCCQVLRELIHNNGDHFTKLEIHGRLGIISHVILETRYASPSATPPEHQMFDFCKKNIVEVKQMLVQYCKDRKNAGYVMLQDPLLPYYEAVCVGINDGDNDDFLNDFEDILETSPLGSLSPVSDDFQIQPQPVNQVEPEIIVRHHQKSSLAMQRQRTGKLTLKDFAWCNSFTINKAAKSMNVCPTVLKKVCRRHGLSRWPYRKINSLRKQISSKKKSIDSCAEEVKKRFEVELEVLEKELAIILDKFNHP